MAINKITCCKDCADRHPGCHGSCEKYIQQRAELDAVKAERRKQYEINSGLNAFRYDGMSKIMNTRVYRGKYRKGR